MDTIDEEKCRSLAKKFGTTLIKVRNNVGINQEELAHRVGSSQTYLSQLEGGKKSPSLLFLYKLSEALEMDIKDFFN